MSALSKLLRLRSSKSPSMALSSLLFPKHSSSANSFVPEVPKDACLGFRRNVSESFVLFPFGSRSFYSESEYEFDFEMRKGDWTCDKCQFINFARNSHCKKCRTEGPSKVDSSNFPTKPGDWACPNCRFMNFSKNGKCLRCQEPAPKRTLNPGDWQCTSCSYLNFRRNKSCLKCLGDRPKEANKRY